MPVRSRRTRRRYTTKRSKRNSAHRRVRRRAKQASSLDNTFAELISAAKATFLLLLFLSIFIVTAYIFSFYSYTHIETVNISGVRRLETETIESAVRDHLAQKHLGVLPGEAFAFVNTQKIANMLQESFPIDSAHIEKEFPNTINITVDERISALFYTNREVYELLTVDGQSSESIRPVSESEWSLITTSSTKDGLSSASQLFSPDIESLHTAYGQYPLIIDVRPKEHRMTTQEKHAKRIPDHVGEKVVGWYTALEEQGMGFQSITLEDPRVWYGTILTSSGLDIVVDLSNPIGEQLTRLTSLLDNLRASGESVVQVDLRFGDQVYWE